MSVFPRISTTSVGQNKNAPRVWIEGRYLLQAGFVPAKHIQVEFGKQEIRITLAQYGPRKVSSKRNGEIPVLDLNSSAISESFGEIQLLQVRIAEGEIILTPAYSEQLRANRCSINYAFGHKVNFVGHKMKSVGHNLHVAADIR